MCMKNNHNHLHLSYFSPASNSTTEENYIFFWGLWVILWGNFWAFCFPALKFKGGGEEEANSQCWVRESKCMGVAACINLYLVFVGNFFCFWFQSLNFAWESSTNQKRKKKRWRKKKTRGQRNRGKGRKREGERQSLCMGEEEREWKERERELNFCMTEYWKHPRISLISILINQLFSLGFLPFISLIQLLKGSFFFLYLFDYFIYENVSSMF